MPRTPLPVTGVTTDGATPIYPEIADPVVGNSVANDGATVLIARNTGTSSRTLSIQFAITIDGQSVTPKPYAIPAGETRYIGAFPIGWYGSTMQLDPDSTDLQLAAVRLGQGLTVAAPASPAAPFTADGNVVVAWADYPGVDVDGYALVVDSTATASTIDGNVLVVTV